MAHDVFISYSSDDKAVADAACATLESRKIRCWVAPRDVPAGVPWASALVKAISASKVVVLILSEGSNSSTQVIREVDEAVGLAIPILPLRIDDVQPSDQMRYYIKSVHWLDALSPPMQRHLERLADSVEALLGVVDEGPLADLQAPPPVALPPESIRQKFLRLPPWGMGLLAFAALLILGGGGWYVGSQLTSPANGPERSGAAARSTPTAAQPSPTAAQPSPTPEQLSPWPTWTGFDWRYNPATDHFYAATDAGMSWVELEDLAMQQGGHLVAINDVDEHAWLRSNFFGSGGDFVGLFWVGLTKDPQDGTWSWTTGEPWNETPAWCTGQPGSSEEYDTNSGIVDYRAGEQRCLWADGDWHTDFLVAETGGIIPSYPGLIEAEERPASGRGDVVKMTASCSVGWNAASSVLDTGYAEDPGCTITNVLTPENTFELTLSGQIPEGAMAQFVADGSPSTFATVCLVNYGFLLMTDSVDVGILVRTPSVRYFTPDGEMTEICSPST